MLFITLSDSRNNSSVDPPVKPPVDGRLVKLAPLIAGKVAGNAASGIVPNLASGIVPDVKLVAFKFVRSTGKLVKLAPSPVKDVAVTPPVTVAPLDVISNLVLPPVCSFKLPVPASLIIESLLSWNISKSLLVPKRAFTLSL